MTGPVFLVMPQWQGSPSSRAMQLIDGAAAIKEDLPESARREVPVPLEAGDALGTPAARLSSLLRARASALEILRELEGPAITLGGDCASTLPGLERVVERHSAERVAVLWFDAHPDLQHPSTSPSGAVSGMALRHALGDGIDDLAFPNPVGATHVTLVGSRAIDDEEDIELERRELHRIGHVFDATVDAEPDPAPLAAAVRDRLEDLVRDHGVSHVYVHVDLDVLDPSEFAAVHAPVPFGLSVAQLTAAIRAATETVPLAGAAVCEFAPADRAAADEDLPTVLRVLAALTARSRNDGA